ncbi:MAG: lactonase family protein [Chitinophagaceae bacterium]
MKIIFQLIILLQMFTANAQHSYLVIGTYTSGKSEGIYVYDFNSLTGTAAYKSKIKAPNPSFLTVSPNQQHVYAAFEEGNGKGSVGAYRFNKTSGELSYINQQNSGGDNPCYVAEDKTGKWVAVANYSGGSFSLFKVAPGGGLQAGQTTQHTGSSFNKERQEKAHVHSTFFSKDNKFLFAPDLGMDKLMIYAFDDKTGKATPAAQPFAPSPDNGGPRHIAFAPNNRYAYLMQELTGTVVAYKYNSGKFDQLQTISAAEPGFKGFMGSADIHVSDDGKFVYCSNRGEANTITIFKIDPVNGKLTVAGYQSTIGTNPRNFSLDPTGNFLLVANQGSDNIIIFKRNKTTGLLTDTGNRIDVGNPVCLKWISKK